MFLERKLRHQDVCLFGAMFRKYLSMYGAIVSCELIFFFFLHDRNKFRGEAGFSHLGCYILIFNFFFVFSRTAPAA